MLPKFENLYVEITGNALKTVNTGFRLPKTRRGQGSVFDGSGRVGLICHRVADTVVDIRQVRLARLVSRVQQTRSSASTVVRIPRLWPRETINCDTYKRQIMPHYRHILYAQVIG